MILSSYTYTAYFAGDHLKEQGEEMSNVFVGPENIRNDDIYRNIVHGYFRNTNNLVSRDEIYTNVLRKHDDSALLSQLGFSQKNIDKYDEDYYVNNDLLIIAFFTNTAYKYKVTNIFAEDNLLSVLVNEYTPHISTLVEESRIILIDIDKGVLHDGMGVEVEFNRVIDR